MYLNLHKITSRVLLFGDCKFVNIKKEVKKLQASDTKALESKEADLWMQPVQLKNDEVEELHK